MKLKTSLRFKLLFFILLLFAVGGFYFCFILLNQVLLSPFNLSDVLAICLIFNIPLGTLILCINVFILYDFGDDKLTVYRPLLFKKNIYHFKDLKFRHFFTEHQIGFYNLKQSGIYIKTGKETFSLIEANYSNYLDIANLIKKNIQKNNRIHPKFWTKGATVYFTILIILVIAFGILNNKT